ncbi:unnamed protein product [Phytophthora fragariaefolia]|uniref:Elongator complex protein 2 n=1 Tax=Phytophthora fragariaefolia TaxID=1490495 RepID=A0A9W6TRT3_9STRA|nr:unnamed protein product [Phytophthora fragariaefolia]
MEALDATAVAGDAGQSALLAAGGVDAKLHLFEVAAGSDRLAPLLALEGHRGWIHSVAFKQERDGDELLLASASQDQRIRVWKVTARTRSHAEGAATAAGKDGFLAHGEGATYTVSFDALLVGHEDWVTSVQWMHLPRDDESHDDTALLSSSMDNTLIVWAKSADSRGSWIPSLRVGEMSGNGLLSAGVLPERGGRLNLVSLNFSGQLERWEQQPAPSKLFQPAISINGHCREVTDLAWSPRGEFLVSVSLDQTARVLAPSKSAKRKLPDWYEISRAQVHGYDINCGCFVLGDHTINGQFVSGADEKILRVFEAPDEVNQLVGKLSHDSGEAREEENANSETKARLVHHAYLPELSLTNKSTAMEAHDNGSENGYAQLTSSVLLPVGDTLGRKTLWPEQRKLYGHGNELLCVTSSHAGDLIASACKSREERYAAVRLWNTADWAEAQLPLEGHKSSVVQLAFSPNDHYLLSVSRDRQFCLYERQLGSDGKFAIVESVKAHRRIIWSCSWSPDSSVFVLGSRDQSCSLWGRTDESWAQVCDPLIFDAAVTAVAFLPSVLPSSLCYLLAVGLETGIIEFFTVSNVGEGGMPVTCLRFGELAWKDAPSGTISRLAWCPAKTERDYQLAVASSDSSVRVYSLHV